MSGKVAEPEGLGPLEDPGELAPLPRVLERAAERARLAHALLFSGAPGLGQEAAARALARSFSCRDPAGAGRLGGCGACADCRQVDQGVHPDVRWVAPAPASIRIDQVREVLREAHLRPLAGRARVFVFREAERMTEEAANALLKALEDPPAEARFVLLAVSPGALLPTVRSRCQEVPFRPLEPDALARALARREGVSAGEAARLALLSEGNPGLALALLWSPEARRARELGRRLLRFAAAPGIDPAALFGLSQELDAHEGALQPGGTGLSCLDVASWELRDLLIAAVRREGRVTAEAAGLIRALTLLRRARRVLDAGVSRRLVCEVVLLKLRELINGSYNFDQSGSATQSTSR